MTKNYDRKLPVGIQSFEVIRKDGYLYVDKTDIIWQLTNRGKKYNYLSRPRRFGKSLLVDTLQAYFEGRQELFEGLNIMKLEKAWKRHPVIRLDMSIAGANADAIKGYLADAFTEYEQTFGIGTVSPQVPLPVRLKNIIKAAYDQTGQEVAILIDEYDSPLQHSWNTPHHEACTEVYRDVFAVLKMQDRFERFVFITGITKFTQISLFSVLNNLSNISFDAPYAALCGLTKEEIKQTFQPEIQQLGQANGWSTDEALQHLKEHYDGYHFSRSNMVDVFNPYSLINALADKELRNYWASSGATSLLTKFVDDLDIRIPQLDNCAILASVIEMSDVTGGGPELFLYQAGYLTIKGYISGTYLLGIPNHEVRQALNEIVLPALAMRRSEDIQSTQAFLNLYMNTGNLPKAKKCLKALIADVPYSNKKLKSMDMEERYRLVISTIFNAVGCQVQVERMMATGRIDMVVSTSRFIYVIELKLTKNGGLSAAEKQMKENNYAQPFKADKRKVVSLAIELDDAGKGLIDWKQVE